MSSTHEGHSGLLRRFLRAVYIYAKPPSYGVRCGQSEHSFKQAWKEAR